VFIPSLLERAAEIAESQHHYQNSTLANCDIFTFTKKSWVKTFWSVIASNGCNNLSKAPSRRNMNVELGTPRQ